MRMCLIGLALSAALAATGQASAASKVAPEPTAVTVTTADRAEFRRGIGDEELVAVIMSEFLAEYGEFETQLLTDAKAGALTPAEARNRTLAFLTMVRTKAIAFRGQAPDSEIFQLYERKIAVLKEMQRASLAACYSFGEGSGIASEIALPPEVRASLNAYERFSFKVGISGRKAGIKRRPLMQAEFAPIIEQYKALGGDIDYLRALSSGTEADLSASSRCDGAIRWLEAITAQPPEFVARFLTTE